MRQLTVDGNAINKDALKTAATAIAAQYMSDSSKPKQIAAARGFQSVAPSESISRVEWDQKGLTTHAIINDWFSPTGTTASPAALSKLSQAAAHPAQLAAQSRRTELAVSGATQPTIALQPQATQQQDSGLIWVKLSNPAGNAGTNVPPAAAQLTYTISRLDGSKIADNVAVAFARQLGHCTAASNGLAQQDQTGAWKILRHDEVIDATNCT